MRTSLQKTPASCRPCTTHLARHPLRLPGCARFGMQFDGAYWCGGQVARREHQNFRQWPADREPTRHERPRTQCSCQDPTELIKTNRASRAFDIEACRGASPVGNKIEKCVKVFAVRP